MGDNASQNKPSCRMTGSKKGVRFNVTPPYAHCDDVTFASAAFVKGLHRPSIIQTMNTIIQTMNTIIQTMNTKYKKNI